MVSPCVWPLLPGYVSFISGEGVLEAEGGPAARSCPILLFIAGFTIVFVLLGAFASTFVKVFKGDGASAIGGAIVIAFGVLMIGYALGRGSLALYAERRPFLQRVRPGTRGRPAARHGVRRRVDAVHRPGARRRSSRSRPRAAPPAACCCSSRYSVGPRRAVPACRARGHPVHGRVRLGEAPLHGDRRSSPGALMIAVGVLLFTGEFTRIVAPLAERFTPGHLSGRARLGWGGPHVLAQRLTLRQSVALVWRTLRSMRTALILLLLLALASVAGSLLPQWPNTPERVAEYRADHAFWGSSSTGPGSSTSSARGGSCCSPCCCSSR